MSARTRFGCLLLSLLPAAGCRPSPPAAGADAADSRSGTETFRGLDPDLAGEIRGWKRGDPTPGRLLQFPAGPPAVPPACGLSVYGQQVGDDISRITDP
ncbi:MAG TPA: hypothetical protein VH092_27875 [Urbifossiella sp.]|jgi:hypothetical protein|nr:hypothetical protein [Urbifossiella sp.]